MKTVYFIRHGQSTGNRSLFEQQNAHTELSKKGIQQAKKMAQHLKNVGFQSVIASPFERTQATADFLHEVTGVPVTLSELFVERRRPSVQLKKRKTHPSWVWTQVRLMLSSHKGDWRHSDEESPEELLQRAHDALTFLSERSESSIAVVTHGVFTRALYADITLGEGVSARAYLSLTRRMQMRNTALMIATLTDGKWEVNAWNVDASTI